jgi:hypothetical protein
MRYSSNLETPRAKEFAFFSARFSLNFLLQMAEGEESPWLGLEQSLPETLAPALLLDKTEISSWK